MSPQDILKILALSPDATAIYSGKDIVIEVANDAMLFLWGKDRSVIGKKIEDAIPELKDQPFVDILKNVMSTGVSYRATNTEAHLVRNGVLESIFFDFVYEAVTTDSGDTYILQTSKDVTQEYLSKRQVITLNENLSKSNLELASTNELLQHANLALAESQRESELQRKTLYDFFMQAPAGICILAGKELVFELVNPVYQQLLPQRELTGRSIFEALPEIVGQPVEKILRQVFDTGEEAFVKELLIPVLSINGEIEDRYFTFNYQPRRNVHKEVDGILAFVYEVTEQVIIRTAVEERERHFKHLADLVPAKISNALPTGEVTFFNKQWLDFSGLSFEDTRDFGYHNMMHPDEIAPFQKGLMEAASKGKAYMSEMRFKNRDGKFIWHLNIASPILDENGHITMWVGSTTDIQRLKEEEQRKSDFVSMLSHELRTPITSIKGYIQLFLSILNADNDVKYPAMFKPSLQRVDKLVTRLTSLVDEMLNLGKIEFAKLAIKKQTINLNELVKTIVDDFQVINKNHEISLDAQMTFSVNADPDKIGQVLINFISNAIKYAPDSRRIDVAIQESGNDHVAVSVKDYGIGIDTAEHKNIFDRFYRVERKDEWQVTGFGIGLFIAQSVIEAHGGQILLESSKGEGASFTFVIPI